MNTRRSIFTSMALTMLLITVVACSPSPAAPAASNTIEITNITEGSLVTGEIIQTKAFDQCDSGSAFKAQVQFSESSGQSTQKELVLSGGVGGELGVSAVAKVQLQGAVEQHFSSSTTSGQGHQESVDIEVPAHTQQEYTIVWRESRREGTIEYNENGAAKSVNYSYRIGLELVSARGKDIDCPGQGNVIAPTNPPIPTQVPTTEPVNLVDTPANSELSVRQSWVTNGVILTLESVELGKDNIWWHEFTFYLENRSGGDIFFNPDDAAVDMLDANYAIADEMHSYRVFLPQQLANNEGARFVIGFNTLYEYDPLSTSVEYFYIRVSNLSRIDNAVWKIIVPH